MNTHDDFADSLALIRPARRLVRVVHRQSGQVAAERWWPTALTETEQNDAYFALVNEFSPVVHRIEWVHPAEMEDQ